VSQTTSEGAADLARARNALLNAKTTEQLHEALAIVLLLDYGLSPEQVALAINRSVSWVNQLYDCFQAEQRAQNTPDTPSQEPQK
jgi:hypothetical protein